LLGKPEGKRPLGRYRRRCEDNIKIDFRDLTQDRDQRRAVVNTDYSGSTNFFEVLEWLDE
jgi:hypothetical protein